MEQWLDTVATATAGVRQVEVHLGVSQSNKGGQNVISEAMGAFARVRAAGNVVYCINPGLECVWLSTLASAHLTDRVML